MSPLLPPHTQQLLNDRMLKLYSPFTKCPACTEHGLIPFGGAFDEFANAGGANEEGDTAVAANGTGANGTGANAAGANGTCAHAAIVLCVKCYVPETERGRHKTLAINGVVHTH
jgi:hypothetical protein